ncbi:EamA family transporter [uncultured Roseibium sp.]|uniref:EamA family transporter n=1 Tax=uncultured Roseibium sp. TaxID=1936171 RepID=UPI002635F217|nr:EamA family transporter [uncultured Roseibium sp.]
MSTYLPFILFTVLTNAAAQIMLKYGMTQIGDFSTLHSNLIVKLLQVVFTPFVFLGLCTFVISMASHLYVLSKVELSYAYPFLSLAYVVVAVYAFFIFHEDLNAMRVFGIALICVGTAFIAQGGSNQDRADTDAKVQQVALKETSK